MAEEPLVSDLLARLAEASERLATAAESARPPLAVGRREAARLLSVSAATFDRSVQALRHRGFPQPVLVGGIKRWPVADLERWLKTAKR